MRIRRGVHKFLYACRITRTAKVPFRTCERITEQTVNAAALVEMPVHGLMGPRGLRCVALAADLCRNVLQLVSQFVHLGNRGQIKIGLKISMTFGAVFSSNSRSNAVSDQLESLVLCPGVGAALSDICQA